MATPEGKVKAKARQILEKHGAYFFMPVTGGFGTSGLFDEVACINGIFLGIEYKATKNDKPTPLQIQNARRCMQAGGVALLIHKDNLTKLDQTLHVMGEIGGSLLSDITSDLCYWPHNEIPKVEL